jgi:hypothetical protein
VIQVVRSSNRKFIPYFLSSIMKYISWLLLAAATLLLSSCYTEPNPLSSVATVGGPVALVRNAGFLNTTRVLGSDIVASLPETPLAATSTLRLPNYAALTAPTPGSTVQYVVEYTTLDAPVTAVNLYVQSGTTRTRITNTSVNVAPSANRVRQTMTYTVPMTTTVGSRIILLSGVVTAGGESFSGNGVSGAGTAILTVR